MSAGQGDGQGWHEGSACWNGAQCSPKHWILLLWTSVNSGPVVQLQSQGSRQVSFWIGSDTGERESQGQSTKSLQLKAVLGCSLGKWEVVQTLGAPFPLCPYPAAGVWRSGNVLEKKDSELSQSWLRGQLGRPGMKGDLGLLRGFHPS